LGGGLLIRNNGNLISLTGLDNIEASSITELHIFSNPELSTCDVQSICDYLASPNGGIDIENNAPGCNSPEEVEEDCENNCLPEGITFSTQEQIDNFQINYPNCTEIEGDVLIGKEYSGSSNITNLNGLNVLTSIGGELNIKHNDILPSLTGLDNLIFIEGSLVIRFNDDLSSLTGLEGLTTIGGMFIGDNESLPSLTGLDGLTTINGGITIDGNDALTNLTGLEGITTVEGSLEVYWNTTLTSFTGLDNVASIEEELFIVRNAALTSLTGLESLITIDGDVYIAVNYALASLTGLDNVEAGSLDDLSIYYNPSLSECEVQSICNYLVSPNGTIDIYGNAIGCNSPVEIANACGITLPCLPYGNYYFYTQEQIDNFQTDYPNCTQLNGNVLIRGNDITNLNGFNVVTSIGGDLNIYDNPVLTSLSGFDNLISIEGSIHIGTINWGMPFPTTSHNPLLSNLYALNSLTTINGDLSIVCNDSLTSLTGLEGLTSIGGGISIMYNNSLTSLTGLENLTSIDGNLLIGDRYFGNASLPNLSGLEDLTTIKGGVGICSNPSMTSLTGLENLTSIGQSLSIGDWSGEAGNASLPNLTGLEGLTAIGGGFGIYANDSMTSLTGLQNLTSIGAHLEIRRNPTLANLSGLENIEPSSITTLDIRNNPILSSCDVQSICDYLANPNGEIYIWGNAPGCNSPEEVMDSCMISSVNKIRFEEAFTIAPNPMKSNAVITYTLNESSHISLKILDLSGRNIITLINEVQHQGDQSIEFNATGLPAGIYFCVLKTNPAHAGQTAKVIKL